MNWSPLLHADVPSALAPTVIGIEACGASDHRARILRSFGHEVKLITPQLVKPYVKRGKNDTADAEALCEAMSRPAMRFVPVKTAEQQAALMMVDGTAEGSHKEHEQDRGLRSRQRGWSSFLGQPSNGWHPVLRLLSGRIELGAVVADALDQIPRARS